MFSPSNALIYTTLSLSHSRDPKTEKLQSLCHGNNLCAKLSECVHFAHIAPMPRKLNGNMHLYVYAFADVFAIQNALHRM